MANNLKEKFFEQSLNQLSSYEREIIRLLKDSDFQVEEKVFVPTCSLPGFIYYTKKNNHVFNIEKIPNKQCVIYITDLLGNKITEAETSFKFLECIRYVKKINDIKKTEKHAQIQEEKLKDILSFLK